MVCSIIRCFSGCCGLLMLIILLYFLSEFLRSYETVGSNIVTYNADGKPGSTVQGSPVVPNSAKKIVEEGETVMYSIAMIKNHFKAGHFDGDTFVPGRICLICRTSFPLTGSVFF